MTTLNGVTYDPSQLDPTRDKELLEWAREQSPFVSVDGGGCGARRPVRIEIVKQHPFYYYGTDTWADKKVALVYLVEPRCVASFVQHAQQPIIQCECGVLAEKILE
jgi:hypothetical protein